MKNIKAKAKKVASKKTPIVKSKGAKVVAPAKKKPFPDVNKDGKITKMDVLMAKGVIKAKKK